MLVTSYSLPLGRRGTKLFAPGEEEQELALLGPNGPLRLSTSTVHGHQVASKDAASEDAAQMSSSKLLSQGSKSIRGSNR